MTKQLTISDAIYALGVDGGWKIKEGKIAKWYSDQPQPSDAAINSKLAELQAAYDAQEYSRNRKVEYDALNQFELISDDDTNGTTTHKDAIAAIKAKYPKPK
jgi:hypothetical protein